VVRRTLRKPNDELRKSRRMGWAGHVVCMGKEDGSLFYDAFSVNRLCSVGDRVISE
jgi:hypothetical protein